jgi:penicillin amidase
MGDPPQQQLGCRGHRTASGQAILCSDPTRPLAAVDREYAIHGPRRRAGAGHPGAGLFAGANGAIARAHQQRRSTRDLSGEVDPADPVVTATATPGGRSGSRDQHLQAQAPARHTLRATGGPIVNACLPAVQEGGDPPLALRWVGLEHLDDIRAAVAVGRARDWPAFRAALVDWSVAVFNFGDADRTGRVGYQCAGRVPLRGRVVRGYREANNPADTWRGSIPYEAMPRLEDPPRGYIASANQRVVPDDIPTFSGAYAAGHRGTRIEQALEKGLHRSGPGVAQNDAWSAAPSGLSAVAGQVADRRRS